MLYVCVTIMIHIYIHDKSTYSLEYKKRYNVVIEDKYFTFYNKSVGTSTTCIKRLGGIIGCKYKKPLHRI